LPHTSIHASTLPSQEHRAIAALLAETTDAKAASTTGISVQKLRRWMKEPEFETEHGKAKRANHRHQIACLKQVAACAVTRSRSRASTVHILEMWFSRAMPISGRAEF
jgi:hypothetical protein